MIVLDHLNREVEIPSSLYRIVSLCPSQTELLFDLGLEKNIAGITQFCIHPKEKTKLIPKIGGTKNTKLELIRALKPDLILAEKEENLPETILQLEKEFPLYVTNVESFDDALKMIRDVGMITQTSVQAQKIIEEIKSAFSKIDLINTVCNKRMAYFIWKNPYMVSGKNTYIHSIIEKCGWQNVFSNQEGRYPQISLNDLENAKPDLVLLSSEPYPFKEKHIQEIKNILPDAEVLLADGEMFSWYGSRMIKAGTYLCDLIKQVNKN